MVINRNDESNSMTDEPACNTAQEFPLSFAVMKIVLNYLECFHHKGNQDHCESASTFLRVKSRVQKICWLSK